MEKVEQLSAHVKSESHYVLIEDIICKPSLNAPCFDLASVKRKTISGQKIVCYRKCLEHVVPRDLHA